MRFRLFSCMERVFVRTEFPYPLCNISPCTRAGTCDTISQKYNHKHGLVTSPYASETAWKTNVQRAYAFYCFPENAENT